MIRNPDQLINEYNLSPRIGINKDSVPNRKILKYSWKFLAEEVHTEFKRIKGLKVEDRVWVKLWHSLCTTRWKIGTVRKLILNWMIEVDGMPRHRNGCKGTVNMKWV